MQIRFDPHRNGRNARLVAAAITFTLAACGSGGGSENGAGSNDTTNAAAGATSLTAVSAGSVASATKSQRASSTPSSTPPVTTTSPININAPVIATPTGRLLASNCFQCHGTNGFPSGGFDKLAGQSAREIANEMKEMARSGEKGIMHVMALGYTDEQAWQLATYFSTQR